MKHWNCPLSFFRVTMRICSLSANSMVPGQTAQMCRLAWLYTGGKDKSLSAFLTFMSESFNVHNFFLFLNRLSPNTTQHKNLFDKTFMKVKLNLTLTHKWHCPSRSNYWILLKFGIIGCNLYMYLYIIRVDFIHIWI